MGANMFSNGREIYVGTSSANIYDAYEDPTQDLILTALKMNTSIADTFKEAYPIQIAKRSKSLFRKAADTVFEYPTEALDCSILNEDAMVYLTNHMKALHISVRVEEDSTYITNTVENILVTVYGWDKRNNSISIPPTDVPAVNHLENYKVNLSNNSVDFSFSGHGIKHTVNYPVTPNLAVGTVLRCTAERHPNEYTYFNYTYGSGVAVLDTAIKTVATIIPGFKNKGYFPVIPFYINDFEIGAVNNSSDQRYIDGKRLLKTIGMNYEKTAEELRKSSEGHTGRHKGLYAYMLYGVDPLKGVFKHGADDNSEANKAISEKYQGTLNYLFEFFLDKKSTKKGRTYIQISDDSFQSMIRFDKVSVRHFNYASTDVGYVTGVYRPQIGSLSDVISYTKQLTKTVRCTVNVYGLVQEFNVHNGHTSIVRPIHSFDSDNPSNVPNVEGVQLRLPLNKFYADRVRSKLQHELYHNALCFVFNSYQSVKVKWYQDPGWGFVIKVIAVVLAWPTGGQSLTWSSALLAALKFVVQMVIMRLVTKGLIKLVGVDAAAALILIASAYGYFGKSYETAFACVQGLPFADLLLSMSTAMWTAYGSELQEMQQDLQKDLDDLDAKMKKEQEDLLTAKKLLETGADNMNPWLFTNPLPEHSFSEYPDQMIDKLMIGVKIPDIVVNAPSNYVDLMLTLPTFDETIRMNTRGK